MCAGYRYTSCSSIGHITYIYLHLEAISLVDWTTAATMTVMGPVFSSVPPFDYIPAQIGIKT